MPSSSELKAIVNTQWDMIVVGAGSAGCVLANRLSKDAQRKVLLIEAGPKDNHLFINMPAAVANAISSKKFNWHYWTSPQAHLNQRRLTTPRGKVLGGSSSINALVCMRGQAEDYDDWQRAGCKGWSYRDVLPYFRETETHVLGENEFHGGEGELYVGNPESANPMFEAFIQAGVEMGFPRNEDFNGASQNGFGPFHLNIKDGKRHSSSKAFLHTVTHRENLSVLTNAQVLKVLFSATSARGVQCLVGKQNVMLNAEKVILSAGSIATPQLLLLSGIGPADELKQHAIRCLHDLPGVGKNLHDHLEVKVKCRINQALSLGKYQSTFQRILAGSQYLLTGKGVCRQQGLEAGAFITIDSDSSDSDRPDSQLHFINALAFDGAKPEDRGHGFAIDVTPLRPESRGELRLSSSDPLAAPLINPNYLATEYDRAMLRKGLVFLRDLCKQQALQSYVQSELFPGVSVQSDEQLDAVIRETAESIYHPVGTAKMGIDNEAVVDPETMLVRGLQNLYVADASVMPQIVSGNTHAVAVMIAAKAADLILNSV